MRRSHNGVVRTNGGRDTSSRGGKGGRRVAALSAAGWVCAALLLPVASRAQAPAIGQAPTTPAGTPLIGAPQPVQPSPASNVDGAIPPAATNPRVSISADTVPFETGKGPRVGAYYLNRAEDDFAYLRDPGRSNNFFDPIKFVRLNESGTTYLTFSGEERARFEAFTKNSFTFAQPEHNDILQIRSKYGADLHLGSNVRGFVEAVNGAVGGQNYGQPSPGQRNDLALIQAFGEATAPLGNGQAGVRVGRQELWLGSGVIFSTREGSNVPSSLDGVRAYYDDPDLRIDAFAVDNVVNHYGALQDATNAHSQYWGVQATRALPGFTLMGGAGRLFLEPFYFGNYSRRATFANATGNDARHMFGGRLWGQVGAFDVDTTGAYQVGDTGDARVSAYALFANAGYTFEAPMSPRVGVRFSLASGGRDGPTVRGAHTGGTLNTFNPLLPVPGIFSESLLIAPINLIEVVPGVGFSPTASWRVFVDTILAWRYAERDGIYNLGFGQFRNTLAASGRYLGVQPAVRTSYAVNRNVTLSGALAYFDIGTVFRNARAKNNAYTLVQTTLKF